MPGARVAAGDRVTLRTPEEEDVPFLQRAYANPELRYPLGWEVRSRGEVEDELDDRLGHDELFVICLDGEAAGPGDPEEDAVRRIGCIVAGTNERARSGIGFWVVPSAQGEGYGTEAASPALDYLFRVSPTRRSTRRRCRTTTPSTTASSARSGRARGDAGHGGDWGGPQAMIPSLGISTAGASPDCCRSGKRIVTSVPASVHVTSTVPPSVWVPQ